MRGLTCLVFICLTVFISVSCLGQVFRLPEREACVQRKIHFSNFRKRYHFSWLAVGKDVKFNWEQARNYCRRFCMDSVSFESFQEYKMIKQIMAKDNVPYIWTAGRKCNFAGCDRPDLQPAIINGWFWANNGKRLPPPEQCSGCDWSHTGGLNLPQPDNREFRTKRNGEEEACIAVLNNVYGDGIRWHDVGCSHVKPIICQDEANLLNFVNVQ